MPNPNNVNGNNTGQQIGAQFGIPTSAQITPNAIDPDTGHASLGSAGDSMAGTFVDPNGIVGGLYNDILGFTSQEREFNQQWQMTKYENEWNSAQQQMIRAKEAGINPLTAAAGIVGSGTGSVASAAGSATPSSDLVSGLGNLGRLSADNAAKNAAAGLDTVNTSLAPSLADASIFKDAASAASALVGCGIPEIAAMELGLSLARNGLNGFSSAFNADNYCRMYDYEMDKIDADINKANADFADTMSHLGVNFSQAQLNSIKAAHEATLKQFDDKRLEVAKNYEAFFANGDSLQQFLLARQFGVDSPEYLGYMNFLKDKFYNQSKGSFDADIDTVFSRSYNDAKARADVDASFRPYLDFLDEMKILYQAIVTSDLHNPDSVKAIFGKLTSLVTNTSYRKFFDNVNINIDRSKPTPGNADSSGHN